MRMPNLICKRLIWMAARLALGFRVEQVVRTQMYVYETDARESLWFEQRTLGLAIGRSPPGAGFLAELEFITQRPAQAERGQGTRIHALIGLSST